MILETRIQSRRAPSAVSGESEAAAAMHCYQGATGGESAQLEERILRLDETKRGGLGREGGRRRPTKAAPVVPALRRRANYVNIRRAWASHTHWSRTIQTVYALLERVSLALLRQHEQRRAWAELCQSPSGMAWRKRERDQQPGVGTEAGDTQAPNREKNRKRGKGRGGSTRATCSDHQLAHPIPH